MSSFFTPLAKFAEWVTHPHKKRVYMFHEGSIEDRSLLGNKGANLCEMVHLKLPVPPGFVITTESCLEYFHHQQEMTTKETKVVENYLPQHFIEEYTRAVHELERQSGRKFGCPGTFHSKGDEKLCPLLLSVRSGAAVSMPGMMDTILNLGMNDEVAAKMVEMTQNPKFVMDTYRRFLQMFGTVVLGVDKCRYEDILTTTRNARGVVNDSELGVDVLQLVVNEFKEITPFPNDPWDQLRMAIVAVFNSWFTPRAIAYRDIHSIRNDLGTAVTVQCMVFGNMNARSGSGVCFTRNPSTGEKIFMGEYLANAEGEDVVSGVRTPMTMIDLHREQPAVFDALSGYEALLEQHYRDMQDIEFTVENGRLYVLQTRTGKRTPKASVRIAVSLAHEKIITEREALLRIDADQMHFFLHPTIDPVIASTGLVGLQQLKIGKGLPASAGAAVGKLVFTCEDARQAALRGEEVILCREDTSADDIIGLEACAGVLTMRGGMTSHAAVVARSLGRPSVTGASAYGMSLCHRSSTAAKATAATGVSVEQAAGALAGTGDLYFLSCKDGRVLHKGDLVTIDGSHGDVYSGEIPTVPAGRDPDYQTLLRWADQYKRMRVLANADTVEEANKAKELGAEGIGLCRTEHMFFQTERLDLIRAMILSTNPVERRRFLDEILPMQQGDFVQLFRTMRNRPVNPHLEGPVGPVRPSLARFLSPLPEHIPCMQVTIRLLDPPLHEFLPHDAAVSDFGEIKAVGTSASGMREFGASKTKPRMKGRAEAMVAGTTHTSANAEEAIRELAQRMQMDPDSCVKRARELQESNPMLGFRGCRLSIVLPEITEMQVKAIIGAALAAQNEGFIVRPEIMIPLVCCDHEVACIISLIHQVATAMCVEAGEKVDYKVGCMIEVPRACVRADSIAAQKGMGFLSIGTNDLTQLTYGFSRDDTSRFLPVYMDKNIMASDPFVTLDQRGVGTLVHMAVKKARKGNPKAQIGVCGEHGGDPDSIMYFDALGLDYVSCSPFRIPTAKIAAAQAHIRAVARRRQQDQAEVWRLMADARGMF